MFAYSHPSHPISFYFNFPAERVGFPFGPGCSLTHILLIPSLSILISQRREWDSPFGRDVRLLTSFSSHLFLF